MKIQSLGRITGFILMLVVQTAQAILEDDRHEEVAEPLGIIGIAEAPVMIINGPVGGPAGAVPPHATPQAKRG